MAWCFSLTSSYQAVRVANQNAYPSIRWIGSLSACVFQTLCYALYVQLLKTFHIEKLGGLQKQHSKKETQGDFEDLKGEISGACGRTEGGGII
jgi:hypothetical protein